MINRKLFQLITALVFSLVSNSALSQETNEISIRQNSDRSSNFAHIDQIGELNRTTTRQISSEGNNRYRSVQLGDLNVSHTVQEGVNGNASLIFQSRGHNVSQVQQVNLGGFNNLEITQGHNNRLVGAVDQSPLANGFMNNTPPSNGNNNGNFPGGGATGGNFPGGGATGGNFPGGGATGGNFPGGGATGGNFPGGGATGGNFPGGGATGGNFPGGGATGGNFPGGGATGGNFPGGGNSGGDNPGEGGGNNLYSMIAIDAPAYQSSILGDNTLLASQGGESIHSNGVGASKPHGSGNQIGLHQTSFRGNAAEIRQIGSDNTAAVYQAGPEAEVLPNSNETKIRQDGYGNQIGVRQIGEDSSRSNIEQHGVGNETLIDQSSGGSNAAENVAQFGDHNEIRIYQKSDLFNDIDIKQGFGSENRIELLQHTTIGPNIIRITQHGSGNVILGQQGPNAMP